MSEAKTGPRGRQLQVSIGRYQVQRALGTGAVSTVFEALDKDVNQLVAIKVLAEKHAANPQLREQFIRDAQALHTLGHQSIITVHDIGQTSSGQPYLAMDLVPGGDLATRLKALETTGGIVSPEELRALIRFLGAALRAVHDQGLVHRDVAPGNILLPTPPSQPKSTEPNPADFVLGDFGMVKDLAAASGVEIDAATQGFRSPEQRTADAAVDHRADLYGASAVVAVVAQYGDHDAPWQSALTAALDRGMATDPAHRPATAAEWERSLLAALSTTKSPLRKRANPKWILAAGVALVAGLALMVWSPGGDTNPANQVATSTGAVNAETQSASPVDRPPVVADAAPAADTLVFDDALAAGWFNQSWGTDNVSFDSEGRDGAGIKAELGGFGALSLSTETVLNAPGWLTFWVRTTSQNPSLAVRLNDADGNAGQRCLLSGADVIQPGSIGPKWAQVQFALDRFPASSGQLTRISILDRSGEPQTLEVDQLQLTLNSPAADAGDTGDTASTARGCES